MKSASVEATTEPQAQRGAFPRATGSGPRVRTISKDRNSFWGTYKKHEIHLTREDRKDDWYIQVIHADGGRLYDGPWGDSAGKTKREAILEALHGAMLFPNIHDEPRA